MFAIVNRTVVVVGCFVGGVVCDVTSLLPFYTFALSPGLLRPAAKTRPPLNIANGNAL